MLPLFARLTSILSISDILENSCSITEMRLSKVIPDRADFSSTSITCVLVNPAVLGVVSFTVPNVDTLLVSNCGIKVFDAIASFGRYVSVMSRVMST